MLSQSMILEEDILMVSPPITFNYCIILPPNALF